LTEADAVAALPSDPCLESGAINLNLGPVRHRHPRPSRNKHRRPGTLWEGRSVTWILMPTPAGAEVFPEPQGAARNRIDVDAHAHALGVPAANWADWAGRRRSSVSNLRL